VVLRRKIFEGYSQQRAHNFR